MVHIAAVAAAGRGCTEAVAIVRTRHFRPKLKITEITVKGREGIWTSIHASDADHQRERERCFDLSDSCRSSLMQTRKVNVNFQVARCALQRAGQSLAVDSATRRSVHLTIFRFSGLNFFCLSSNRFALRRRRSKIWMNSSNGMPIGCPRAAPRVGKGIRCNTCVHRCILDSQN